MHACMYIRVCVCMYMCMYVCMQAFEWFQDLLEALEAEDIGNFLEIHIYLTAPLKAEQVTA
jgi:hypothetical protein